VEAGPLALNPHEFMPKIEDEVAALIAVRGVYPDTELDRGASDRELGDRPLLVRRQH
jgi:hypothetical protein